ncbi:MAG: ATP-binding protein [Treponema sp.]|nr:ATP-binding protein [Treponema sp.]MCL2272884.1 ATP-binding protein [Treponema sp.]
MAKKKTETARLQSIGNISAIIMLFIMSFSLIAEALLAGLAINYSFAGLVIIVGFIVVIAIIRNSINYYKLAFNIPVALFFYLTVLMMMQNWHSNHFFLFCFSLCAISCVYSGFFRSVVFVFFHNLFIGIYVLQGTHVGGAGVPFYAMLVNWGLCIFGSILMLIITKSATISLDKALENQNSFRDLLDTTENFVAMIDERNQVVYASKTLSQMSNIDDPSLVQGRPLIDLFPGKGLKIHAGKMLKEKDNYAEDWEFALNGQKRYFKTVSHSLPGESGTLISMYDMTHLAERDEIAVMKDSMKIGLFFIDKNYTIQDHYSRYLEEMLSETDLAGKLITDVISDSVTGSELEAIKDYFNMVVERTLDLEMLEDINPLNELRYVNARTGEFKVFQFAFATVERNRGEVFILVTVYDITTRVELQQRLAEEESRRQEEMQSVFEVIKVEPNVFNDFMEDMEHEFGSIDKVLKNEEHTTHEALVKIYQSIHAVKSNAVILGLSIFGNKLHMLESKIKKLRERKEAVPFGEMLTLTMDIEKISQEKDGFKEIISKLQSYGDGGGEKQTVKVLIDSLAKCASKASEDMEKQIRFISNDIDAEAVNKGPRRVIKEILMQLIRNSAVHGIETPEVRKEKGKPETGIIRLSIKLTEDKKYIQVKLSDDGRGLDYNKIAQKAIAGNIIKKEEANNKDMLTKAIFMPGFSTAETEGVHAGRGIGLNLVRDRIKEIRGTIKLHSENDKGIVFFVVIPMPKSK